MAAPRPPHVDALAAVLARGRVLVVSGAGISTDSGIPDYRGPTGARRHADPMTFQRFVGSLAERRRYWARSHLGWPSVAAARPNAAHDAVAALGEAGGLTGVVTQNVDGLHGAAGSPRVIDLHGRLDAVVCLQCSRRRPRLEVGLRLDTVNPGFREAVVGVDAGARPDGDVALAERVIAGFRVVDCRSCGGVLKPDVVFFGENVPASVVEAAWALYAEADAVLVVGSSLTVYSGRRFVDRAARDDRPVAVVNLGPTRADEHATVRVEGRVGEVLPRLAERLSGAPTESGPPGCPAGSSRPDRAPPRRPPAR